MGKWTSPRTTPARRALYLQTLAETGNQRLAASVAKVSPDWARPRRASDPEFAAAYDAAMAEAAQRMAALGASVGPNDVPVLTGSTEFSREGEELIYRVRKRDGEGQLVRAKARQWTPRIEARFLAAMRATCNVTLSCAATGLSMASAYAHRDRSTAFGRRWREAEQDGFIRLDFALIENSLRSLEGPQPDDPEPDYPLPQMNVRQVIKTLQMHRRAANAGHHLGPRWRSRPPDPEAARKRILRTVAAVQRHRLYTEGSED